VGIWFFRETMSGDNLGKRIFSRNGVALVFLAPILLLPLLLVVFPPDGGERSVWAQFLGHFHPLVVHLPIAFVLLIPVLELVGRDARFSYLRTTAPFVLLLALISLTVASILGWCLARSAGYSGPLVTQHMWGAASLMTLCWLCWVSRGRGGRFETLYSVALAASIGVVAWTGYRGGQISLGENHLTESMPPTLRNLLGIKPELETVDPGTFYAARIQPIFASQCMPCHSREKRKGGLRLDSYAGLIHGGKDGPAIKAGDVHSSDLFRRITLPAGDDNFMPKGERPALSADQIKAVELWIANGASATAKLESIPYTPSGSQPVRTEVTIEKPDPSDVAKRRAETASALATLQQRFPNVLDYQSRSSAEVVVNASLMGARFSDNDVAALAPVASHVVLADFSRTGITDKSAPILASMKHLRVLRLMHTRVSDRTLQSLAGLDQLVSLSVFDTAVTSSALPAIANLRSLQHFYAGQTSISARDTIPEGLKAKLVF
jgi:uncharacterized membrane protein